MSSIPSKAVLVDMYRRMTLIKQNDERFRATIMAGKIVAPYYSPRGQEVIPSAVSVNLRDTDYICTIYRGIHDMLAKGVPMKLLWAEIAGKVTGTCKGKGGPMHITHHDRYRRQLDADRQRPRPCRADSRRGSCRGRLFR
jgi:acetoin:2,6-dichlorophenolindophenol oxidoreductase subunit alpha